MNTSNQSQNKTQNVCLGSKQRSNTYAYILNDGIYLNITNRCTNDCIFCLRNNGDTAYGSEPLWLEREPSACEIIEQIDSIFFDSCNSFVLCGYGEPTCRFSTLIETAKSLKSKYPYIPIRLNTNGQSELINGVDSTQQMFGLIDSISISLNCSNKEDYDKLCHPVFGNKSFDAIIEFGKRCVGNIPNVQFSVVEDTLTNEDIEICKEIVSKIGAKLRVRKFISENDKNPE